MANIDERLKEKLAIEKCIRYATDEDGYGDPMRVMLTSSGFVDKYIMTIEDPFGVESRIVTSEEAYRFVYSVEQRRDIIQRRRPV